MNFLTENWQVIAGLVGGIVTYFGSKKIKSIDEKDKEASALQNMQMAYDKFTEQTNKQIDRLITEIEDVKAENRDQRGDLRALQKDNSKLHIEVSKLMQENNELKQMIAELRAENEELRRSKANKR